MIGEMNCTRSKMSYRYSKAVAEPFMDVSEGDYYADSDGHWLTLKKGFSYMGGQIVHEWSVKDMLAARRALSCNQMHSVAP